jgi:hypothetical protein
VEDGGLIGNEHMFAQASAYWPFEEVA